MAILAFLLLPGTLLLCVLTLANFLPLSRRVKRERTCSLVVVIPAHNEEKTLPKTLQSLGGSCDVVVIADNCSDRTEDVAHFFGARVLSRSDANHIGKGFALQFAVDTLLKEGYDAFFFLDADGVLEMGALDKVREAFECGFDAVQVRYEMCGRGASFRSRLLPLAFRAMCFLRARGRERLHLSCGILGNGFGLHRSLLEKVPFVASSLVEDMAYHIELVAAGFYVHFLEDVMLRSDVPCTKEGEKTQRLRWEVGRLQLLKHVAFRLCGQIMRGRVRLIDPLFDLLLPPLSLYALLMAMFTFFSPLFGYFGLSVLALHLSLALFFGDKRLDEVRALACVPWYVFWKVCLLPYGCFLGFKRGMSWVRTERRR